MGVSFCHSASHFGYKLMVLQPPSRHGKQARRRLRNEAFEHQIRAKTLHEIYHQIDILIGGKEVEISRTAQVFFGHPSAPDELELMELKGGQRQCRQRASLGKHHRPTLPRKPEDEMRPHPDAPLRRAPDGIDRLGMRMTPVDAPKRLIIDGLDAILHQQERAATELLQIVKQIGGHAVGTRANDQPHHAGHTERLLVLGPERIERIVSIRVGLKIGQILHLRILSSEELLALLQLLSDGLLCLAIVRIERLIVAVSASARADPPVAIGTGEAGIERNLLGLETELSRQPGAVVVVEGFLHRWDGCH